MATTRRPIKAAEPAARERRAIKAEGAVASSSYFASGSDKTNMRFISSGCSTMDEALGGGYVLGRVSNIVGDRSAGKTLKAMEAIANFAKTYPDGWIRYGESEAAFDEPYAAALGIPVDRIIFNHQSPVLAEKKEGAGMLETVEDWYEDLKYHLDHNKDQPGLYVIDSLDALSDEAEQKKEFDEGSYGGTKPKQIGKLFRTLVTQLEEQEVHLMVISQLRDKLNVTFGETKTRSGGRALDFYATHIVWLAELEKIKRTIDGIDRIVGVKVEAYVKKNKVGLPFRKAKYPILFGYGIDDLTAGAEWLVENKREALLAPLGLSKSGYKVRIAALRDKGGKEAADLRAALAQTIHKAWQEIETTFLPTSKKY